MARALLSRGHENDYGFHIARLSSPRRKSMVRSTEHLRLTRSATGEMARLGNSLTHRKRLSVKCESSIALMETRFEALRPKGCLVLFQLPPNFSADQARLATFIQMLPNTRRYAFEFRHRSWYHDGIMELLQSRNAALCISDHGDAPSPWEATANHVYVRGHGPGGRYRGSYSAKP